VPALSDYAVPILPSSDLARTAGFLGYLGLDVVLQTRDYLQATFGDLELHYFLADGVDQAANCGGCLLRVADPDKQRALWCGDGVECLEVAASGAYGHTAFAVVDPDGNLLRVGHAMKH
jgi:catechol 2,3-dioxygenase-like lactoylglutathione lyase family enzyme